MPLTRLIVFGVALLALGVPHAALGHTYIGKALRATVQDPTAGLLVGIDTERISAVAFGLGTAFAGFAGSLLTLLFSFNPDFGGAFQLKSFRSSSSAAWRAWPHRALGRRRDAA